MFGFSAEETFFLQFLSSALVALREAFFFAIISISLSYLVLPIAKLFNRVFSFILPNRLSWNLATITSFLSIIGLIGFGIFAFSTLCINQVNDLIKIITDNSFVEDSINFINSFISNFLSELNNFKHFKLEKIFGQIDPSIIQISNPKEISSMIAGFIKESINSFTKTGKSLGNGFFMISLYSSATFHIIREWGFWEDRFDYFANCLTRANSRRFLFFINSFSKGIKSWILGQSIISSLMACYYSLSFAIVGIIAPIPIGIMFGFSSFLPFVGDIVCTISLIVSFIYSKASVLKMIIIAVIIFVGHMIGGHILGPILIGSHTGVNPVQSIVGFIVYSYLFGFRGIFLGLPISLFINSLLMSYFYKEKCDFQKMQILPDDH